MMDFKNHIDNTKSKNSEWFLERDVNVSRRHKFIYMKPAKTAGTSIYRHWLKGLNAKDIFNRKDDPLEYMDWWKNTSNETMMTEYFKFVFVRNPFERLVSAYTHLHNSQTAHGTKWLKIPDSDWPDDYTRVCQIEEDLRPGYAAGHTHYLHTMAPTFKTFVKYHLLDSNGQVTNIHWLPQCYYYG